MSKEIMQKPTAFLDWSLNVECPKCEHENDLADSGHDYENQISTHIFSGEWGKLGNFTVTCEECLYEFSIDKVEY